jgi:hypothetical protein
METSKFLKAFETASRESSDSYQLVGDICVVEEIKDEDFRTKSGLVIASGPQRQVNGIAADKPSFVRVLIPAPSYEDIAAGDICLVPSTSIRRFSVFGKLMSYGETTLGLINAESIQLRFKGQNGFERFFDTLNRAAEAEMAQRPPQG